MASGPHAVRTDTRKATVARLKADLHDCIERADALGLTAIAIHLQRALDELAMLDG